MPKFRFFKDKLKRTKLKSLEITSIIKKCEIITELEANTKIKKIIILKEIINISFNVKLFIERFKKL